MSTEPVKKFEVLSSSDEKGAFKRKPSQFRDWISSAPNAKFPPELNRYHLYVSLACPWAHRALITRALKGLTGIISVSIVHWFLDSNGWRFINPEELKSLSAKNDVSLGTVDHLYGYDRLRQLYFKAEPEYAGRFTVPILWDKKLQTIVSNESSEIIRMLNSEFNALIPKDFVDVDIYPTPLHPKINELNEWIYDNINNGVYKSGFASKQEPYDEAVTNLFDHLDKVEDILEHNHKKGEQFMLGNQLTEVDIRLFTTIIRFDPVYHQHFKCNIKMIRHDYPHIHEWVRLLYWKIPGFRETTDFDHIKFHYTRSHLQINPYGITPKGPLSNILPLD
ncbi:extra cellular matrix protein [Scheffersomyces coipomensis]|uniref:extra cellular matrix protein n=1 Tax=Scheffersomyces coipomensis TaxID=1788519 RepID=UPI00315D47B5